MATHSSTLAWKIPWTEEPGRLQSMGSQRVGHNWATSVSFSLSCIGEGNGNPLQCSCPKNPRDGMGWPVGLPSMGSHRVGHDWSDSSSSRFVVTFLPRSKCLLIFFVCVCLLISWLQSPSAVILEPRKIKSATVFTVSPSICHEVMGSDSMILVFWMLSFKPTFSLSFFTFIKRLFSSSSLSAIRVVSSAYLRLLIFLLATLIPACPSSSLVFLMMYSAYKLNKQGDNYMEPVCSMSSSNCFFLACMQVSQEAGQVVWYDHLFQNFPQFIVIHTVKCFGMVNEAEIDVFLELACFSDDPSDVGNLISGSSAFSKTSLNIWKFTVHILLKPGLENFKHHFTRVLDECNCAVVWAFFGIAFLWDWNENWPFPVLWPLLSFPNLLAYWVGHWELFNFSFFGTRG